MESFLIVSQNAQPSHYAALLCINTHDSESRGQEEAAVRDERVSYLYVAPL